MIIALLLLAHTISDFIFQDKKIIKLKENLKWEGYLRHGLHLFLLMFIFFGGYNFWEKWYLFFMFAILHIIFDYIKCYISFKINMKDTLNLIFFVIDQLVHLIIIVIFYLMIDLNVNRLYLAIEKNILINYELISEYFIYGTIILYVSLSGAYLVPLFLNVIYSDIEDYRKSINKMALEVFQSNNIKDINKEFIKESKIGKWIGILERILILFFFSKGEYMAITLIIGIKSLTRYKLLNYKIFAEYYLLGTLASLIYSIIGYSLLEVCFL